MYRPPPGRYLGCQRRRCRRWLPGDDRVATCACGPRRSPSRKLRAHAYYESSSRMHRRDIMTPITSPGTEGVEDLKVRKDCLQERCHERQGEKPDTCGTPAGPPGRASQRRRRMEATRSVSGARIPGSATISDDRSKKRAVDEHHTAKVAVGEGVRPRGAVRTRRLRPGGISLSSRRSRRRGFRRS